MSKEKETKKAAPKKTAKKAQSQEPQLSKEEKAEQARDLYTRQFIARVEAMMEDFVEEFQVNENLTSLDRRRLTGAGVRNNGFIDKAA